MVALTMNAAIVDLLKDFKGCKVDPKPSPQPGEPSLDNPQIGKPITYGQLIDLSIYMLEHGRTDDLSKYELTTLLQGSEIHSSPRKYAAKAQGTEYQKLMERLRREEQEREYKQMTNLKGSHQPAERITRSEDVKDEMTYSDVNRQMTLIVNVLLSIVACGIAIWMIARHFSTPKRLALSMAGSGVVGIAEVVVYFGYIRRLIDARSTERAKAEARVITNTWVIGSKPSKDPVALNEADKAPDLSKEGVRQRTAKRS